MDTLVQFKTHISTPSIKLKYAYLSLKMTTGKTFTIPWYWSDSDIQSVANERGFESNYGCGGGGCWYGLGRRELLPMWRWLSSAVVAQAGRGAGGLRAVAAPPVQAKQGSRQETLSLLLLLTPTRPPQGVTGCQSEEKPVSEWGRVGRPPSLRSCVASHWWRHSPNMSCRAVSCDTQYMLNSSLPPRLLVDESGQVRLVNHRLISVREALGGAKVSTTVSLCFRVRLQSHNGYGDNSDAPEGLWRTDLAEKASQSVPWVTISEGSAQGDQMEQESVSSTQPWFLHYLWLWVRCWNQLSAAANFLEFPWHLLVGCNETARHICNWYYFKLGHNRQNAFQVLFKCWSSRKLELADNENI